MYEETNKFKLRASRLLSLCALSLCVAQSSWAQRAVAHDEREFGPVVRAYLGYLRAEQEVTDARESRREVSAAYVRRNSNRISALRRMTIQLALASHNDYVPELYAVARDELGTLFETPPSPASFRVGEVLNNTFRFLGTVRANEPFYLFARLDIYEQAELIKKAEAQRAGASISQPAGARAQGDAATRPRRVSPP
jgi:hypothetical protein